METGDQNAVGSQVIIAFFSTLIAKDLRLTFSILYQIALNTQLHSEWLVVGWI